MSETSTTKASHTPSAVTGVGESGQLHIHHLNLGEMSILPGDPNPRTICHCLLLEEAGHYALIDTGMGVDEMSRPEETFGKELMAAWEFQINPANTAMFQLRERGISPDAVTDIVMTHLDVDHAGGLPDFPGVTVHLSVEEHANLEGGNPRYLRNQFDHGPQWKLYHANETEWFGLPARRLALPFSTPIYLIPLFGHTRGHCGVAIALPDGAWLLHAGDTYYRRREVTVVPNPLEALVTRSCDDDTLRRQSLAAVRQLLAEQKDTVTVFSTHDLLEFGGDAGKRVLFVTTSHDHLIGVDGTAGKPTGVWMEEFAIPYQTLRQSGIDITVASPKGGVVPIDPRSAPTPERKEEWAAAMEAIKFSVPLASIAAAADFDALFLPGGHGPVFDLPDNPDLARLLGECAQQGKPIGAVCHGPAGLLGTKRPGDGKPLVAGRRLTSYTRAEEVAAQLDKAVPFILEDRLREQGAEFILAGIHADHVEQDGNLITGQNPQSSASVAHALVGALAL